MINAPVVLSGGGNHDLGWSTASNVRCATAGPRVVGVAHGLMGTRRPSRPICWGRAWVLSPADDEEETGTATRSHEGHMVRVVGGVICM